MNDLQEGEVDNTERREIREHEDLFVVRTRNAADRDQARVENLARSAGRAHPGSGPRAWLGHRLVEMGTFLAGEPAAKEPRPTPGRPC
jgi:hypothetical protein